MADYSRLLPEVLEKIKSNYCLTEESLEAMPDDKLVQVVQKLDTQNRPELRMEYRRLGMLDDKGELPDGAHDRACDQMEAMRIDAPNRSLRAGIPVGGALQPMAMVPAAPGPGLSPSNMGWTGLGPGNIGGRTRALAIDPNDSANLFAGSVGGGVWMTNDSGAHWRPADDLMANLAVCSLVMDPTNSNVMYAGTGEGFGNIDAIRGAGIFKTTDGGASWVVLPSTQPNQPAPAPTNINFYYVNRLAVASDASAVLAATNTGIFRSTDSGVTWKQVLANARIGRVAFAPGDDTKLVASGNSGDGRVFYSIDSGVTWQPGVRASAGSGRIDLAYAKADSTIVYASVQASPSELWKSTDGGRTYVNKKAQLPNGTSANFLGKQGWYDNIVWAGDPTNSDLVIVGGVDLFRSVNGGDTLIGISTWWDSSSAHADHHTIVEDPGYNGTTNRKVWFGNDGGVYFTDNVATVGNNANPPYTNGWIDKNSDYEVTQFYAVASNRATKTVVAGAQDNGTLRYTPAAGTNNWNSLNGGDGGDVASDPSDPSIYYGEYVRLDIFRNTNGGASRNGSQYISGRYWNGSAWVKKPAPYIIPDAGAAATALFIAPFKLDPGNSNRILAGGASLWRTNDAKAPNTNATGPAWASIKPSVGALISAIAICPSNSDLIYVGYANGRIDKTVNGTDNAPNWTTVSGGINANRMCLDFAIDPHDNDVVYAAFGGYQSDNVWKSSDGGQSWTNISANLPEAPVRSVTVHPTDSSNVYIGTEVGVIVSDDAGIHWNPTSEGPNNCCVYDLEWMDSVLLCATHGRGVFQIDLTIHNSAKLVVVGDDSGDVYALNGQTGIQQSHINIGNGVSAAAQVVEDAMYLGAGDSVRKLNPNGLSETWLKALGTGPVDATPFLDTSGPEVDDDVLYAATSSGWLFALNPATGAENWKLNVQNLSPGAQKKVVASQVMNRWIYLNGEAGTQAVDLYQASIQGPDAIGWTNDTQSSKPVLLAAGSVFVPGDTGSLLRLESRSGSSLWEYRPGTLISTSPVWILGGVAFGDSNGDVVIVDFRNGQPLANKSFYGATIESLTADGQKLYVVTSENNGTLSSWSVRVQNTGWAMSLDWSVSLPGGVSQEPSIVGDTLYVTANDGIIYAFNIAETVPGSRQIWNFASSTPAVATPAPVFVL